MPSLGITRSAHRGDHLLQTPDTFVRAPLPGMRNATAILHITPASGARFTQYTAEFDADGALGPVAAQRFVYVLDGELKAGAHLLRAGDYAYFPAGAPQSLLAKSPARAAVIEKHYVALQGVAAPSALFGCEPLVQGEPLMGDDGLEVRTLIPPDSSFDFAVNTMTFQPGAELSMVEIHVMEHGLLMLAGGGIYKLGEYWYPVKAGDFIWMAPYCPQWFGALGKAPAKYLIYKDWNR